MALWDDTYDAISAARDAALGGAGGEIGKTTVTYPDQKKKNGKDPIDAANNKQLPAKQSYFPAAQQFGATGMMAATAYPAYQALGQLTAQNQVPVGGFGLGALSQAGYSRSPQMSIGNFLNQGSQSPQFGVPQPGLTLNEMLRSTPPGYNLTQAGGGGYLYQPSNALPTTQYTLPTAENPSPLADLSVGALKGSTRYSEMGGKRNVVNTPSGGQIVSGASFLKPRTQTQYPDIWRGGWLSGGRY